MQYLVFLSAYVCFTLAAPSSLDSPANLLSVGNRKFATTVYKEIMKTKEDSFIFSPFSAETILALTAEGARGDTRKQLINALRLPEANEVIHKGFEDVLTSLPRNYDDVKLLSANKIYVADGINVEEDFRNIAAKIYGSDIEDVDFGQNEVTAVRINKWIEEQTYGNVKDVISSEQLDNSTAVILVNTLYLHAIWQTPFEETLTRQDNFYLTASKVVNKSTMQKIDYCNHYESEELDAQILELSYDVDGLNMIFVLPNEIEGLQKLENNIEQVFLQPDSWSLEVVDLKLPRFTIDSKIQFKDILQSLGVTALFDNADLSGISSDHNELFVSDVIQRTFVEITETGTEAASATEVGLSPRFGSISSEATKKFHVNRPFIFYIKYEDLILFVGKYSS